jgi:sugar-specific transcriptional regulator TrmB
MSIQTTLSSYGLTDKESDLYLANLSLGEASMTAIAEKAGLKRPTAYKIFESLKEKGLMGSFKMRSGMRFVATKPEILVSNLEKSLTDMKSILPDLHALDANTKAKPRIQYFHGVEGYKNAIEDSLNKPNITLRHIGSLSEIHKIKTKDYDLNYYMPKRISKNIFLKSLYFGDTATEVRDVEQHKFLRDIRYIPDEYQFNSASLIYEDKVIITSSHDNLMTIMITNEDIANAEKKKFDLIWNLVGPGRK